MYTDPAPLGRRSWIGWPTWPWRRCGPRSAAGAAGRAALRQLGRDALDPATTGRYVLPATAADLRRPRRRSACPGSTSASAPASCSGSMAEAGADVRRRRLAGPARRGRAGRVGPAPRPAGQPRPGRVPGPLGGGRRPRPGASCGRGRRAAATSSTSATVCCPQTDPDILARLVDLVHQEARAGVRVAVIGGGIAGLAAAWELPRARPRSPSSSPDRLGGKILHHRVRRPPRRRGPGRLPRPRPRRAAAVPGARPGSGAGRPGRRAGPALVRGPAPPAARRPGPRRAPPARRRSAQRAPVPAGHGRAPARSGPAPAGRPPADVDACATGRRPLRRPGRRPSGRPAGRRHPRRDRPASSGAAEVAPQLIAAAAQRSRSLLLGLRAGPPAAGPVFLAPPGGPRSVGGCPDRGGCRITATRFVPERGRTVAPAPDRQVGRSAGPTPFDAAVLATPRRDRLVELLGATAWPRTGPDTDRRRWSWSPLAFAGPMELPAGWQRVPGAPR